MSEEINIIKSQALEKIAQANNLQDLDKIRVDYLGKSGILTEQLKKLGSLTASERPVFGKIVNIAKAEVENILKDKKAILEQSTIAQNIKTQKLDITLPGKVKKRGKKHPITQIMDELVDIFNKLGFEIAYGPDIETEYYNFEALNIPPYHPSRDMWSTLWIEDGTLLRTHTSPVQIRVMEKEKPPLAYIMPGRVYRRDADVTHSAVFHQVEGLLVGNDITFADLKGTLTVFLHAVFGKERNVRFRPSYFPFTEPSCEIDVECFQCVSNGCKICKNTGWLEILGAGMVDPNVFKYVKYDPEKYSGFAFGVGVERIAMLKYGIDDIRLFYQNDLRFLEQF